MTAHLFDVNGHRVSRLEDVRLITGAGTYASDWNCPDQLYGYFLRSDRAHAKTLRLDADRARSHQGVVVVFTEKTHCAQATCEHLIP
jgi:aerobic carbon-monoxide dehydrogenase large subunit